jgi:hypothetical protein
VACASTITAPRAWSAVHEARRHRLAALDPPVEAFGSALRSVSAEELGATVVTYGVAGGSINRSGLPAGTLLGILVTEISTSISGARRYVSRSF